MKRHGPREWDLGKDGLDEISAKLGRSNESRVYSQQEWVDKQRKERSNDFAPPTAYEKSESTPNATGGSKPNYTKNFVKKTPPPHAEPDCRSATKSADFNRPPPSQSFGPQPRIASDLQQHDKPPPKFTTPPPNRPDFSAPPPNIPPPGFNNPNQGQSSKQSQLSDPPPLLFPPNPYENEFGQPSVVTPGPSHSRHAPPAPQQSKPKMSSKSRLQLHKEMMESWGEGGASDNTRGRGAEVEPPTQMDYFSSTTKWSAPKLQSVTKSSMSDAFACGLSNQLKHFRNQSGQNSGAAEKSTPGDSDDDSDD